MKKISVRFEETPSLDSIEVVVRAACRDGEVEAIIEKLSGHPPDTINVTDDKGALRVIPVSNVVSVSVAGKQVDITTETERYVTRQSLQSLEEELEGSGFLRISRYELVNLKKVLKYDFTLAGTLRLELAGGVETWASRRSIPDIRRQLKGKE